MSAAIDRRPELDPFFREFGVAVTVKPIGGSPIVKTTAIWELPPRMTGGEMSLGAPLAVVAENRDVLALRRDEVPDLGIGSTIEGPRARGQAIKTWRVIRVDDFDPDIFTAQVVSA